MELTTKREHRQAKPSTFPVQLWACQSCHCERIYGSHIGGEADAVPFEPVFIRCIRCEKPTTHSFVRLKAHTWRPYVSAGYAMKKPVKEEVNGYSNKQSAPGPSGNRS